MTRSDFEENVDTWGDLLNFCSEYSCYECDDIYSEDSRDDFINECLSEMVERADDWTDLWRELNDIPTGYEYYRLDDYGEWSGLDDRTDLEEMKDRVLSWGDEEGIWDEEDDEDDLYEDDSYEEDDYYCLEESDKSDDEPVPEEACSIFDLYNESARSFQRLKAEADECAELLDEDSLPW